MSNALLHPDPLIAIAWLIALAVGGLLGVRDALRWASARRRRFNAKFRALDRSLSSGVESMKDRETKLPPIL